MIYTDGVHLITDWDLDELHDFAQGIGLKGEWFQDHRRHPHYDLTTKKMSNKAIKAGAQLVSPQDIVRLSNKRRKHESNIN